jgi:hypothetical protein
LRVDGSKEEPAWPFFIMQIFSPMPNVLAPTLNAMEPIGIILELRFKSGANLIGLHVFIAEKTYDDSLIIFDQ